MLCYVFAENTDAVGSLPLEVSNLGVLHSLTISGNSGLRGKIPLSYGSFGVIRNLNLHNNELSGEVPSQLCNLITLETLNVAGNQLSGHVPDCLGTPTNLLSIDLSQNRLSGDIPSSLFESIGCRKFMGYFGAPCVSSFSYWLFGQKLCIYTTTVSAGQFQKKSVRCPLPSTSHYTGISSVVVCLLRSNLCKTYGHSASMGMR